MATNFSEVAYEFSYDLFLRKDLTCLLYWKLKLKISNATLNSFAQWPVFNISIGKVVRPIFVNYIFPKIGVTPTTNVCPPSIWKISVGPEITFLNQRYKRFVVVFPPFAHICLVFVHLYSDCLFRLYWKTQIIPTYVFFHYWKSKSGSCTRKIQ